MQAVIDERERREHDERCDSENGRAIDDESDVEQTITQDRVRAAEGHHDQEQERNVAQRFCDPHDVEDHGHDESRGTDADGEGDPPCLEPFRVVTRSERPCQTDERNDRLNDQCADDTVLERGGCLGLGVTRIGACDRGKSRDERRCRGDPSERPTPTKRPVVRETRREIGGAIERDDDDHVARHRIRDQQPYRPSRCHGIDDARDEREQQRELQRPVAIAASRDDGRDREE